YVGFAASWDRLVFRGEPKSRNFLGFYLKDGVVRAAVGLDRGGDPEDPSGESELKAVADLIRGRVRVDPAHLADDTDLKHLVSAPTCRLGGWFLSLPILVRRRSGATSVGVTSRQPLFPVWIHRAGDSALACIVSASAATPLSSVTTCSIPLTSLRSS